MNDTRQDKPLPQADAKALRPIGWFMGGVTVVCAVMAVATGYWQQHHARHDFNRRAAPATAMRTPLSAPLQATMTVFRAR